MGKIRCHICGRTNESLDSQDKIKSIEYDNGRRAHLCGTCQGIIEKIAESVIRSHLSFALDSHQELSDFIRSIVESYIYKEPEERY